MTFVPREQWLSYANLLELSPGQRVRYIRENLAPQATNGSSRRRAKGLTQDEFAEALGAAGRQAVIPWEADEREPRDYARQIAALTPYPADAFLQRAGAGVSLATIDLRLRVVEERLRELATAEDVQRGFVALQAAIDRLARARTRADDQTQSSSARAD